MRPRRWTRCLAGSAFWAALAFAGSALAQTTPATPTCQTGESLVPKLEANGDLARIETEAAKTPNGTGRFWRVEREGLPPSFLFGTMHLTDPRILARPASVQAAEREARTVVVETLDVLDGKGADLLVFAHPELLTLPAGKGLEDYLQPDEKRELEGLLDARGMPLASIRTLQPWFTAMGLMLPACEASRIAAGSEPLDIDIARKAQEAGKELVGLESALDQLRAMASMPMELQTANLVSVLKLETEIPDLFETMTEFYLEGRIAAITPLSNIAGGLDEMPEAARVGYDAFEKRIVADRNHGMAEGLKPHLAKGGVFVAVGALHLPGEDGLVELLRAQGYRVTRGD